MCYAITVPWHKACASGAVECGQVAVVQRVPGGLKVGTPFRVAARSGNCGGNCAETAAVASPDFTVHGAGGAEAAAIARAVARKPGHDTLYLFRDSEYPDLIIALNPAEWDAFIDGAKNGEFDPVPQEA